jgi:hypothetical protein
VITRNGDQLFGAKYAYNMQNNFQNWHNFKWVVISSKISVIFLKIFYYIP